MDHGVKEAIIRLAGHLHAIFGRHWLFAATKYHAPRKAEDLKGDCNIVCGIYHVTSITIPRRNAPTS